MASVAPAPAVQMQSNHTSARRYKQAAWLSLALLIATVALYYPVIHHPFTNIDDQGYVYENLHVQDGLTWSTFTWAMRTFDDSNWHPLTWFSHALDCQMFGIDPMGHHAMNMAWHAVDAVVLFWVLLFATGFIGRSFMVAALFVLHPINVESVAWMAERKTMLSTLFFLLALGAYRWYATRPSNGRYFTVAALFVLGLMAKPQIITLPFVFLLWDYWPLRRMFAATPSSGEQTEIAAFPSRTLVELIREKVPLFVICLASALITMKAQHVGRPGAWPYSVGVRLGNSIVAYVRYLGKAIWPSNLAIMYLHPGSSLRVWQVAAAGLVLVLITVLVLLWRQYRYLPVGWFWFLGTMVPTIGLMQVGRQAMADRYAYQSFLGLFILVCWGVSDWARRRNLPQSALPAVSIVVLLAFSGMTRRQINYWSDNLTLWSHTLQATDNNNWVAHDMVAGLLANAGHHEEAMVHYRGVLVTNPTDPAANLAVAIEEQRVGNQQEAIRLYKNALPGLSDPLEQAKAYQNMGLAYRAMGDITQANECFRRAAALRASAR